MEEEYKLLNDQQRQGGGTNRQRDNRNRDNRNQDDNNRSQDDMRLKAKTRGNFLRDYDN